LEIKYVRDKHLHVAGTLSQAHHVDCSEVIDVNSAEIQLAVVHTIIKDLPITDVRLADLQSVTKFDPELQHLRHFIEHGWPTKDDIMSQKYFTDFWKVRDNLCIEGA